MRFRTSPTLLLPLLFVLPSPALHAADPVVLKAPTIIEALAFSPDGKTLATTLGDNTVVLWNIATRKPGHVLRHERRPHALAFSPDGKTLATGAGDNFARLWTVATGKERRALEHELVDVGALAFLPNGKTLAIGAGRHVHFWDASSGKQLRQTTEEHTTGTIVGLVVTRDGATVATLAAGAEATEVRLWDAKTGRPRPQLQGLDFDETVRLAFSPDGKRLAVLGHRFDKTQTEGVPVVEETLVRIWKLGAPKPALSFTVAKGSAYTFAFSPDGNHLAIPIDEEDAIVIFDAATGKRVKTLKGHEHQVIAVAFSPDGRTLASGSTDETVRLWEVGEVP